MTTATTSRGYKVLTSRTDANGVQWLTVRIRIRKKVDLYTVQAEDDGFGLACEWAHISNPNRAYTCVLNHTGKAVSCNCPARNGCKHTMVGEALVKAGELKLPG